MQMEDILVAASRSWPWLISFWETAVALKLGQLQRIISRTQATATGQTFNSYKCHVHEILSMNELKTDKVVPEQKKKSESIWMDKISSLVPTSSFRRCTGTCLSFIQLEGFNQESRLVHI